jgi:hypothetical protein
VRERAGQRQAHRAALGELNTTRIERWQRSIEVAQQEGGSRQYRLFTDREGAAPADAPDVCEVVLSSLAVRHPRQFGLAGWEANSGRSSSLMFSEALQDRRGSLEWSKVIELLTVTRSAIRRANWDSQALVWHNGHGRDSGN